LFTLRKYSKRRRAWALSGALAAALALSSCATGSAAYNDSLKDLDEFAPLAPGGTLYITIDVPAARPILDAVDLSMMRNMNKKRVAQILDRTRSAVAAYYPENAPRRFQAAARGAYPKARANTAFFFDGAWKKQTSEIGDSYWHSARDKMSVSLSNDRAFVSDGDPFTPRPGALSPADFGDFRRGVVLAGWIENAAEPINRFLASLGLPIEIPAGRTLFAVHEAGGFYQGTIRMETPSESHARALAAIVGMARLFMPAPAPLEGRDLTPTDLAATLFANPPAQDGVYLTMRTGDLSAAGAALLFSQFSVYSTQNKP
jgi:hypothetical protein